MSVRVLDEAAVEAACLGGGVFASGGGGWLHHGMQNGMLAVTLGKPRLASIDEIEQDGVIVTVSAIGAPAAPHWEMQPRDYLRAFELIRDSIDEPVVGVMTAQNGYSTSINGWMQSAMYGVPVVDAAGDVRAHPTIKMGAMGLTADKEFRTVQVVVGGNRERGAYLELVVRGGIVQTSNILRQASVESGGFIASARLPLPVAMVRERAALGAISEALRLGEAMRAARDDGGEAVMQAIAETTGGEIVGRGPVAAAELVTDGGFDHGKAKIATADGTVTVYTLNEFMAVDVDGQRVSTYPDTIAVLDAETGLPLPAKDVTTGRNVAVLYIPEERLPLSAGACDPEACRDVEQIMGIELEKYWPERNR